MKQKIGIILIILGCGLLTAALTLFLQNRQEQRSAAAASQEAIVKLEEVIRVQKEPDTADPPPTDPAAPSMAVVEIDGYGYIGLLTIPSLELELPVMADWTYPQLRLAPCRYSGRVSTDDLVIMAHNYAKHFGRLKDMHQGDAVTFTDMEGNTAAYQVIVLEILEPSAVEEITAGDYDLTLFTCTYGGENRVVVGCDRVGSP